MVRTMSKAVSLLGAFSIVVACGKSMQKVDKSGDAVSKADTANEQKLVPVDVTISEAQPQGASFALATISASAWAMKLEGCASGFTNNNAPFTEASPSVQLYQNDLNCLMKLTDFTVNGIHYVDPNPLGSFATYAAGDSAQFEDETDATNKITITVVSQLGSPLSNVGEAVAYSFTKITKGVTATVSDVSDAHAVSVSGVPSPNFSIKSALLRDHDAITAQGAGVFEIALECAEAITGTTPAAACSGQNMASAGSYQMKYVLVNRTSLPSNPDNITAADLEAKFDGSEVAITHQRASGTGDNGGFDAQDIQGPDQIHNNPSMAYILRVVDGGKKSYTFFQIDVDVVQQQP